MDFQLLPWQGKLTDMLNLKPLKYIAWHIINLSTLLLIPTEFLPRLQNWLEKHILTLTYTQILYISPKKISHYFYPNVKKLKDFIKVRVPLLT